MVATVPYRSRGLYRSMAHRAMTSTSRRAAGQMPLLWAPAQIAHPLGALGTSVCACPACNTVPYALAKRMPLGTLGFDTTTAIGAAGKVYTGAAAGAAVTGASLSAVISGALGSGSAAAAGAAAGSFVPIIGTAIGAIIGLVASGVFNKRVDPEVGNFNNAVALYNYQGPNAVLNIADKYLVLAGLFDLSAGLIKGNIPIYKKYGRMGEQAFVNAMCTLIYNAAQSGQITANDTPQSVFNNIVLPWIGSFGYGAMQDANGEMINTIILGLVAEYVTGLYKTRWFARSGDMPRWTFPQFSLPTIASAAVPVAAPAPVLAPPPATPQPPQCVLPYVSNGTQCVLPSMGVPSGVAAAQPTQPVPPGFQVWNPHGYNGGPLYVSSSDAAQPNTSIRTYTFIGATPMQVGWVYNAGTQAQPAPSTLPAIPILQPAPITLPAIPATLPACAPPLLWNGTQCVAPASVAPSVGTNPASTPATIPAGYTQVASDAQGNPIFANAQGVLYQWSGTAMQAFSGQLASGTSAAAQMQAAIQNALAAGQAPQQAAAAALNQAQSAGVAITPQLQQQVAAQTDATAQAPIQSSQPSTAGLSLSGPGGLLAAGAAVLLVMFAGAHPLKTPRRRRSPARSARG